MKNNDADDDQPREGALGANNEMEHKLLASARLDAPDEGARDRAVRRLIERAPVVSVARRASVPLALGLGTAAALVIALLTRKLPPAIELSADAPVALKAAVPPPVVAPPERPRCAKTTVASGMSPLIDDMEDQNARVLMSEGRSGAWTVYHDPTGATTPVDRGPLHPSRIPGGRGKSLYAIHLQGTRFEAWGVNISASFSAPNCYDASAYRGIEFWAKGNARVYIGLQMIDVVERKYGGLCETDCYKSHRAPIDLHPAFERYRVTWQELEQAEPSDPIAFAPERMFSLTFEVGTADTPFDIWIDDVSFLSP